MEGLGAPHVEPAHYFLGIESLFDLPQPGDALLRVSYGPEFLLDRLVGETHGPGRAAARAALPEGFQVGVNGDTGQGMGLAGVLRHKGGHCHIDLEFRGIQPVLGQRLPVYVQAGLDAFVGGDNRGHQDVVSHVAHQLKCVGAIGRNVHRRMRFLVGLGNNAQPLSLVMLTFES